MNGTSLQDIIDASEWATEWAKQANDSADIAEKTASEGKINETMLAAKEANRAAYWAKDAAHKAESAMEWMDNCDEETDIAFDASSKTYAASKEASKSKWRALMSVMSLLEYGL